MLQLPGFYYVKKPKRFVILSSDKSSERNLSCFFDIIKPRKMEHLQSEEPFSSDLYFSYKGASMVSKTSNCWFRNQKSLIVFWQNLIILAMCSSAETSFKTMLKLHSSKRAFLPGIYLLSCLSLGTTEPKCLQKRVKK